MENEITKEKNTFTSLGLSCLKTVIITAAVCTFLQMFIFRVVVVQGSSMYPTYKDGDIAISFVLGKDKIHRFDVVCADAAYSPEEKHYVIKRVIGLPGETVEYKDNRLYVNGEEISETLYIPEGVKTEDCKITAGEGELILLGDNREHSTDSRVHGPYKISDLLSKGVIRVINFH